MYLGGKVMVKFLNMKEGKGESGSRLKTVAFVGRA